MKLFEKNTDCAQVITLLSFLLVTKLLNPQMDNTHEKWNLQLNNTSEYDVQGRLDYWIWIKNTFISIIKIFTLTDKEYIYLNIAKLYFILRGSDLHGHFPSLVRDVPDTPYIKGIQVYAFLSLVLTISTLYSITMHLSCVFLSTVLTWYRT